MSAASDSEEERKLKVELSVLLGSLANQARAIVLRLDPSFNLKKAPVTPADELAVYARALAPRWRRRFSIDCTETLVHDLCHENPIFQPLARFFTDETVEKLRLLSLADFERMVGDNNLLRARQFYEKFPRLFKASAPDTMPPQSSLSVDMGTRARLPLTATTMTAQKLPEKQFLVDGYQIKFEGFFLSANPLAHPSLGPGDRRAFSESAVLGALADMDVDSMDVRAIGFARSSLLDEDIPELMKLMRSLPECKELDISFNRFLEFKAPENREWLMQQMDCRYVVAVGVRRLALGEGSVLQELARTRQISRLQQFIWMGENLVSYINSWKSFLGDTTVAAATWKVCYDAHHTYYKAAGIWIGPPVLGDEDK